MKFTLILYIALTFAASSLFAGRLSDSYIDVSVSHLDIEVSGIKFDDVGLEIGLNNPVYIKDNYGVDFYAELLHGRLDGPLSTELSLNKFDLLLKPYYNLDSSSLFASLGYSTISSSFVGNELLDRDTFIFGVGLETSFNKITLSPQIDVPNYGIPGEGFVYSLPLAYNYSDSLDLVLKYKFFDFDSFTNSLGNSDEVKFTTVQLGLGFKF